MDSFVRIGKPIAQGARQVVKKLPPESGLRETKIARATIINEWPDIVAADEQGLDISMLTPSEIEDCLRLFDLNLKYGPFAGMDRRERWDRAHNFGLLPPEIIRNMIEVSNVPRREGQGYLW